MPSGGGIHSIRFSPAARFGVVGVDAPLPLGRFGLNIVTPQVALRDAGLAWLVSSLARPIHEPCGSSAAERSVMQV
jgi:hypothetical protein